MASLADALADCLEALSRGEDLEECLARHAVHREELVTLLDVAGHISATRQPTELTPEAKERITEILRQRSTPNGGQTPFEGEKDEGSE